MAAAGLSGADGEALRVVPHQLRHTYATTLVNAGMSLQALMALLGHVTAEMTLRYATLASPTLRAAYDEAIGKARPRLPLIVNDRPVLPSKADRLRGEMLKTRVAHGYCSRHLAAEACPYANICEHWTTTCPHPSSHPYSKINLPTSKLCATTPNCAAGPARAADTNISSNASKPTSAESTATETRRRAGLTPTLMAG